MKMLSLVLLVTATLISQSSGQDQACSVWSAVKCSTHFNVLKCETPCLTYGLESSQCIDCFNSGENSDLYKECTQCTGVIQALLEAVTFDDAGGQTCGAFNWLMCNAALISCNNVCLPNHTNLRDIRCAICLGDHYGNCAACQVEILRPEMDSNSLAKFGDCSAWDWIKCGAIVVGCAADCVSGVGSATCIACLGTAYEECKDCVGLSTAIQAANIVKGCNASDWLHCAGALYNCLDTCLEYGIESPQCVSCLGGAGAECYRCITEDDRRDIDQVQFVHMSKRAALSGNAFSFRNGGNCPGHDDAKTN